MLDDLLEACRRNDLERVQSLVTADPTLLTRQAPTGETPLLAALYYRSGETVSWLRTQQWPRTIFEAAAVDDVQRLGEIFVIDPAAADTYSLDGWTPLHLAAFFGRLELVKILLDVGAPMLAISKNNESNLPISAAAAGRRNDVVRLLVERGCPPDARASDQGFTALHLAANNGNAELVEFLLRSGADRSLRTGTGQTAHDLAIKQGHTIPSLA